MFLKAYGKVKLVKTLFFEGKNYSKVQSECKFEKTMLRYKVQSASGSGNFEFLKVKLIKQLKHIL